MIIAGKFNKFDCASCNSFLQEIRGCKKDADVPVFTLDGAMQRRCPRSGLFNPGIMRVLRYYQHYKQGFLPEMGGVNNQPETFLIAIEIILAAIEEVASEFRSKEKDVKRDRTRIRD